MIPDEDLRDEITHELRNIRTVTSGLLEMALVKIPLIKDVLKKLRCIDDRLAQLIERIK